MFFGQDINCLKTPIQSFGCSKLVLIIKTGHCWHASNFIDFLVFSFTWNVF